MQLGRLAASCAFGDRRVAGEAARDDCIRHQPPPDQASALATFTTWTVLAADDRWATRRGWSASCCSWRLSLGEASLEAASDLHEAVDILRKVVG
jgi:hypothetical protein